MQLSKAKSKQNIQIIISIGDYNLEMSIPRQTKVSSLILIVKNYQKIHDMYAPINSYFIGLASKDSNSVIDYWLTQSQLDFHRFTKKKLELRALYSIQKYAEKISIYDFQFLKCLGKGVIGEVYLVRNKITGYLFAMKRLRKEGMHDFKTWEGVIKEKKILSLLPQNNHTVNFHGSFESKNYFNFLLDYYPGGELFFHLCAQQQVKLAQKDIKIYFCQIILAMEYLHKNKILYRDLKPENVLVDILGHLRITDFGMSRFGFEEDNNTDSICGSEQYMAPELMEQKNYNFSADFYSLGAILYEFVTNYPPYYGAENEQKLHQMKNLDLDLTMVTSPYLKQLLVNLLNPDPQLRLCNFQQIKNNPWLSDIDWKQVQSKKQILKFAPNIYKTYIGEEFLELQDEVQRMNHFEDDQFEPIFQSLFNFLKPTSQVIVLGASSFPDKHYLRQNIDSQKNLMKDQMSMKRKTAGFIKQKTKHTSRHKQNYSIQLFEKDDASSNSSHTTSTQNSNTSNLPYNPKTTRNADLLINKQNNKTFKKCSSKKMMMINETIAKISKQPSEKKLLTKQPSQGNLLKDKTFKLEQKITLKQPATPIRLVTQSQLNSGDQKLANHFASIKQEKPTQNKEKDNHFSSRSKHKAQQQPLTFAHQQSYKNLTNRHSENLSTLIKQGEKEYQKHSNMKSKTKQKSKSKDKFEFKNKTKQTLPLNGSSTAKGFGNKVKLPSGTYKIKLV